MTHQQELMPRDPSKDYVVMSPAGVSETWNAGDFWKMAFDPSHPKNNNDLGYLIARYDFGEDWNRWEMHPEGDEFVFCLEGKLSFLLEVGDKVETIDLMPGQYFVVPRNTWHTANVSEPSKGLFVTWGSGTQHRDR